MRALALLYHDVVEQDGFAASGFPGQDANRYKLDVGRFAAHVAAIDRATPHKPASVLQLMKLEGTEPLRLMTFDDGGVSAYTPLSNYDEPHWLGDLHVARADPKLTTTRPRHRFSLRLTPYTDVGLRLGGACGGVA